MRNLFLLFIIFCLWSCSNDSDLKNPDQGKKSKTIDIAEINLKVGVNDERLVFESQAAFEAAVQSLEEYEATSISTKLKDAAQGDEYPAPVVVLEVSLKKYGFQSLFDDFTTAMSEAENYYDTEEGYKQFKERHAALFFAEQPDDYSAYLPVSNRTVAKLLNTKGEVEIAGQVKDLRDITSYQQLVDLGFTPIESELKSTKASEVNRLQEVRCNNRKLWAKVWAKPGSIESGVGFWTIVEVSFRKKGAFGAWYNYKSETTLGWKNGLQWDRSGFSSHDYYFPIPITGKGFFKGTMWVQFRGFGSECGGNKYEFDVDI